MKTLSNHGAGLLRFTQFCDAMNIPEDLQIPTPKWLLSHLVATTGAGSVGAGAMRSWLLGLELWHIVNLTPWLGAGHLKRTAQECVPCETHFKCAALSQGAKFTTCHNSRPNSHNLIAPMPTEPAPVVAMKYEQSHSGAGIHRSLGMLIASQN